MMLFNIKQCRWRSVARQEFEQRPESLLGAADRRRMTPPDNQQCVRILKTWRDAALRIRCATPLRLPSVFLTRTIGGA